MNKQQRDYAAGRVRDILSKKIGEIKKKHTVERVSLSSEDRAKAFKAGKFKVRKGLTDITSYTDVLDAVEFEGESPRKTDDVKIQSESEAVEAQASRIIDELMLGDANEALQLIKQFED